VKIPTCRTCTCLASTIGTAQHPLTLHQNRDSKTIGTAPKTENHPSEYPHRTTQASIQKIETPLKWESQTPGKYDLRTIGPHQKSESIVAE